MIIVQSYCTISIWCSIIKLWISSAMMMNTKYSDENDRYTDVLMHASSNTHVTPSGDHVALPLRPEKYESARKSARRSLRTS